MVSGLDQFPPFLSFVLKKILQPSEADLGGIVDKALTVLITFNHMLLLAAIGFWQLVNGYLIFPLNDQLGPFQIQNSNKVQMPKSKFPSPNPLGVDLNQG